MPTTPITQTAFQNACASVADAIIALDWATANVQYGVAEAILAGLSINSEVSDAGTLVKMQTSLEKLGAALRRIRQDAVQPPTQDISITSADLSDLRDQGNNWPGPYGVY